MQRARFPMLTWWLRTTHNYSTRGTWCPLLTSTRTRHTHGAHAHMHAGRQNTHTYKVFILKILIHIKSLSKKILEIHNWSKCRKQLTMEDLAPTDTSTTQSYTQDSGAIADEGRESLLKPKSEHLPKGRLFYRWQKRCIHYILTIQSLKHDLHMIPLVNIPRWMGKLHKARQLDEELQVINGCWERIRLLHRQAPWEVIQSQLVNPKHIYVQTTRIGFSRLRRSQREEGEGK